MTFLASRYRRSYTPKSSSDTVGEPSSSFLSRLPSMNLSTPTVYHTKDKDESFPQPKPSTSWTTEMSALADRIRDDAASMHAMALAADYKSTENLDRKSISQGMKLVAIAADEFEDGNDTIALEIYLSGIDKILMALPNKTDNKTKQALRQKLTSVEERVGILQIAQQERPSQRRPDTDDKQPGSSMLQNLGVFPIMTVAAALKRVASTGKERTTNHSSIATHHYQSNDLSQAGIDRFKRVGNFFVDATVSCAILIKQSPLPDMLSLLFGYLVQMLVWIDRQYCVTEKAQDFGIECIKFALYMDEQYRLHEFATEAVYMFVAAGIRAAVAYKETPAFHHAKADIDEGNAPLLYINDNTSIPGHQPQPKKTLSSPSRK